jgi:hypothetical protein
VATTTTPPPDGDGQQGPGRTDDPMSADRRVLAVAAASMVGLILVGVVSAQLFTRSACAAIAPETVPDRQVGLVAPAVVDDGVPDVGAVAAEALPDLGEQQRGELTAAIATLEDVFGPLRSVADVRGADRLTAVDGGLVAAGTTATSLEEDGAAVRATVGLGDATVAGSGERLFSLALINPLTGQVDAFQPLDPMLAAGPCIDTATVGTPLAFHLDAGDGELLLLRTDEDGDEPAVELRDPVDGRVWSTPLDVGTAPAGVLAERVTAALGDDAVAVGWRTIADHTGDAVALLDRADGEVRWTIAADELRDVARAGDQPLWVDVLAVGGDDALVTLRPELDGQEPTTWPGVVVAVDVADGTVRWTADPGGAAPTTAVAGPEGWVVAGARDGRLAVTRFDDAGEVVGQHLADGDPDVGARARVLADGTLVVAGGPLQVVRPSDAEAGAVDVDLIGSVARFVDVVERGERVHVLARTGDGALLLSFDQPASDR